ncbi:MAG: hypothetical protein JSU83_07725 [Deltaproteobacteria bacterium]|nr:MAG: hypothetical protein JSU83_07725 [Deltaproteobacteria bacterium]
MIVKRIAVFVLMLACFHFGCASNSGQKAEFYPSGPVIPKHVDIKAKQEYLRTVRKSLKLYNQVMLDIKRYHGSYNFKELAKEIDKYVNIYVKNILLDSELNSSIDSRVEVAKIHLLVTSMYLDIEYDDHAREYLELFHELYQNDTYLLDMTLNSNDVGYPSLGIGMKELEERAFRKVKPSVHGTMYPRNKPKKKPLQE